ncbi:MAG TPA: hypothetical protein VKC51_01830 [Lacunisphaera sp.]|nr:hypothetical protein [Lacunisphaera sp.]
MSTPQEPATWREKIGIWIIVIFGPIWAETYWKYSGAAWLQDLPPVGAALLSAAGGAVGGWLVAKSPQARLLALFSGALAGFGCNYALQLMYGDSNRIGGFERMITYALGAAPGIIIGVAGIYWLGKRAKKNSPPAG